MAGSSVIGALRVMLGMDSAEFEKGADSAERRLKRMENNLAKTGRSMSNLGKKMTLGLTAPLVGIGAAAVRMGSEFEQSMANVSTLVDETTESMSAMKSEVLGVAQRVPVAVGELTSALYDVRSAGIGAGDAMKVLEGSARLGVAGLGSTKEAADIVTSAINAFGLKGEDANRIYDQVFRTVKAGKTTISELGQSFGAVAPVVAQAGVQVDEFLAATAALTTTGQPAAQAQTQLRAAIAGLTRDTKESASAFEQLGVKNFGDLIEKSGGLVNAFRQLREVTGGSDEDLLKLVGSIEGFNAVVSLSGKTGEAFNQTLAGMRSGVNAVDEAFLKQAGTTAAKWQQTQNSLQVSAIKISDALAPILERLADFLATLSEWFAKLDPQTQKWVVGVGALAAALGPVLSVVGTLLPLLAKLGPVLNVVRIAMLGIAANPVILALAGVVAGIYFAWKYWDQIEAIVRNTFTAVKTWVLDKLGAVWDTVMGKINAVKATFYALYDAVVGHSYIPDMVDGIAAQMARLDKVMVEPAKKSAEATKAAMREMAQDIRMLLDRLFPEIAALDQYRKDLATLDKAGLSEDQLREARRRLGVEFGGGGGLDAPDFSSVGPIGDIDKALKQFEDFSGKLEDRAKVTKVQVVKSFKDMVDETLGALTRLSDAIKGGGFLDILSAVLGFGLELGSAGIFGKSFAQAISAPAGSSSSTPGFASGGSFSFGGLSGVDRNLLSLNGTPIARVSKGEVATIRPANDRAGGEVLVRLVDTTGLFVTEVERVSGSAIAAAAPALVEAGGRAGAARMAKIQSRRFPG